jgi:hypothetical protein
MATTRLPTNQVNVVKRGSRRVVSDKVSDAPEFQLKPSTVPTRHRRRPAECPPRGPAGERRDLRRRLGRHRRPESDLPLHARTDRAHHQRHRAHPCRQPGPRTGRRALLAPRGRHTLKEADLLRRDPGGRTTGTRHIRPGRRLRERERPDLGLRPRGADADVRLPVTGPGRARPARQHHPQRSRDDRHL